MSTPRYLTVEGSDEEASISSRYVEVDDVGELEDSSPEDDPSPLEDLLVKNVEDNTKEVENHEDNVKKHDEKAEEHVENVEDHREVPLFHLENNSVIDQPRNHEAKSYEDKTDEDKSDVLNISSVMKEIEVSIPVPVEETADEKNFAVKVPAVLTDDADDPYDDDEFEVINEFIFSPNFV